MKKEGMQYVEISLYYVILFFILREWLVPIVELTTTGHLSLLLLFIALAFVLNIFEVPFFITWIVKLVYIAWFIVHVYSDGTLFSTTGVQFLSDDIKTNIDVLINGAWGEVTDPFRSVLFFILIWMLIYLIHHWLTVRMTIFYFFVLTVFFIATLDTFTEYDGKMAIVKVVILGLVMTALLYLKRLIIETDTTFEIYKYIRYILPVTLAIGTAGIVAVLLPKAEPQWPDPVPYIKSFAGQGETTSVSKVGLGDDDSRLGGSFVDDDTVVFTAHSPESQYWRVETKDFYTSKGWESSGIQKDIESVIEPEFVGDYIGWYLIDPDVEAEEKTATIYPNTERAYVLQPYVIKDFSTEQPNVDLWFNPLTERLTTKAFDQTEQPLSQYEMTYTTPEYSYTKLKTPVEDDESMYVDPRYFQLYLQLPNQLPERVRELAYDIVENRTTDYDKARAIEQYFKRSGFTYETEGIAVPDEGQDYVDQFLFETKIGYCDNFSTSMVVLLRSVGIPARWVKGYANGTEVSKTEDGMRTFEIQNNDAHSWVEAYIEGVGWMPFEPTIGFDNQADINFDLELDESATEEQLLEQEQQRQETEQQKEEEQATKQEKQQPKASGGTVSKWLWFIPIVLLVIAGIVYKLRRKWLPKVHVATHRRKPSNAATVQSSYKALLKQLEFAGLKRQKSETLQAFAKRVDDHFGTNDMSKITALYEKTIYSKDTTTFNFSEIQESWEYLINSIGS